MAKRNWFTPRTLLVIVGLILLGLMIWRFFNIVAYILIASVLSLITRPLVRLVEFDRDTEREVRLLGRIRIYRWQIPISIRALLVLFFIWIFFFSFFRIFIPVISSEAQDLSTLQTSTVVNEFQEPIEKLETWLNKLNLGGSIVNDIINNMLKLTIRKKLPKSSISM